MKTLKNLLLSLFVMASLGSMAQIEFKMKNGTETINPGTNTITYYFFDSGGKKNVNNAEYWTTWYQQNESYLLHLVKATGNDDKGIKITFDYLLINNDHLLIYEGDEEDDDALIVDLTCNDYSTGYGNSFTVMSHGNMTIRFISDRQYRDEGWEAEVELVDYEPQAPVALMEACDNKVHLLPGSMALNGTTEMYYTINGGTKTKYTGPFAVNVGDKVIATLEETTTENNTPVTVASAASPEYTFTKIPTAPSIVGYENSIITREPNTNKITLKAPPVPQGANETYWIRYTIDGSDPRTSTTEFKCSYGADTTIEVTQIGWVRAVIRGTTCPDLLSDSVGLAIGTIYLPAPTINVTGTPTGSGSITMPAAFSTATIYYTIDGTDPSTSTTTYGTSPVPLSNIPAGTTIKAIAHTGTAGYDDSPIATFIYIPDGAENGGVFGDIVLLDDREDHSWSYYSDENQPIRSLNPADVKITYFGNGTNNISTTNGATPAANRWTQSATTVQVSYNETANQFVYLKTLERADGATSQNPTGNCAYTTIPNPFSKRPTYQYATGDLNRYCGFYGWRVKRVTGGSIQNYAVGATIPAETEIQFVPAAEYGMEVELEALWARAYVKTGNANTLDAANTLVTDLTGGSYERNFFVITSGNTDNAIDRTQNPVTISTRYPDGTSGGSLDSRIQNNFTCNADTKFEYVVFRGGTNNYCQILTANNHNLIIGRGVTTYNNGIGANIVRGMDGSTNSRLNYTIRLESGVFNYVSFTAGYYNYNDQSQAANYTFRGTNNNVKGVLGCDYDRAVENASANYNYANAPLRVVYNMILGATPYFSNQTETEFFNATIKSGYFGSGFNGLGSGSAANSFYLGMANTFNTGKRKLTIEGGNLNLSIAGGIDEDNTSNDALTIRMKGGKVGGAVYGAAAFSSATGGRRFIFTGGTVNGWIAGGCNGTQTTGGKLSGNTFIYFGGKAQCNSNGSNTTIGPGNATGGNIFGAGSGNANATATATVGEVDNSTIVIADEAIVERNVYGGGNYGYVANGTTNKSDLYVLGGTVNGSVFGGANMQKGQNVNIWVKDGEVKGSVYGGSNTQGTVNYDVTMNITGGEVKGNVFGGGYGDRTNVTGNVTLTLGEANATDSAIIGGDVYGGSEQGKVNSSATNTTIVTINKAKIIGDVYGGGYGRNNTAAHVNGKVTVNINGGSMHYVFGCNNLSGAPQSDVTINFNGGTAEDVYGGGNEANYANGPVVNINGGIVTNNVYGGGNLAEVAKTQVNITDGTIQNSVYAGAKGGDATKTLVNGNKTVNMRGGTANYVYGGSFKCKDIKTAFVNIAGGHVISHVFGSGYFGKTEGEDGNCYVYIGKNAISAAPHHGENNEALSDDWYETNNFLYIENNVYAGANWGTYDPKTGFGQPTIDGNSNIYIDGLGYDQTKGRNNNYMVIGGSVYGSGTSSGAGKKDSSVIIRNYGLLDESTYTMSRNLRSIQRVNQLILDNSNIDFVGQGNIESSDPTEEFGMISIRTIRATNGTNMSLSKPVEMLNHLGSYTCNDVYATNPTYQPVGVAAVETVKNGIVINHGSYLMVRYDRSTATNIYGALEGYFYMQEPTDDGINNEGYVFARPKYTANVDATVNVFSTDGGFVSYDASKNTFDANGEEVPAQQGNRKAASGVQMPYTNRTESVPTVARMDTTLNNGEYRFWRFDPKGVDVSSRNIVFVVKAHNETGTSPDDFYTTEGTVQLPPTLADGNTYHITNIKWGAKGKDCNPAPIAATAADANGKPTAWMEYNNGFQGGITNPSDAQLSEYFNNPNSTFGFRVQFGGDLTGGECEEDADIPTQILNNESFDSYYKPNKAANKMAVACSSVENLPELQFMVTYSNRISQNEMWAEATITIEERDENGDPVQIIYLYVDVTTMTMMGQDVETSVYASTASTASDKYEAQLTLPTFALDKLDDLEATFTVGDRTNNLDSKYQNLLGSMDDFINGDGTQKLALQFYANENGDGTDGWNSKGINHNTANTFDFKVTNSNPLLGTADGRNATTIKFDLHYNHALLALMDDFKIGQKYLGYLTIRIPIANVDGISATKQYFDIKVHVYVTGATKYYYLDGEKGKDGNSGMFPEEAKKTLTSILNADGYTSNDPIFVVNGVTPNSNSTLSWDASAFNKQVNVYRYPGSHFKKSGDTLSIVENNEFIFYNGMYTGPIVTVPEGTEFDMINVRLSGGSDLDNNTDYNPKLTEENVTSNILKSNNPLISIANGATASIENSSLLWNNNTNGDNKAGAIYNKGTLKVDGVRIDSNTTTAVNELGDKVGAGVYHDGEKMELGNTAPIVINEIYMTHPKVMTVPQGTLYADSKLSNILVQYDKKPIDTKYSGRVIVHYDEEEPTSEPAPYWKGNLPERESSILKNRKAAGYESDMYELHSDLSAFKLANGGDANVLPFITDEMKADFDNNITSHDIIMYSNQANLPVELLYFTAECMGEATQLQWSTASETNNEYFTIERSSDAVNYEEVARIQGAGTTSQRNDYSFMVDNNSNAITYYRLRQTDIDGKYEIFAPIAIQCQNNKAATEISIYPVPANDQVNIFSSNSPMTRIEIYSIMGAKVAEEPAEGNQTTLHIGNLATGVYAVKVFTEDGQVSNVRLIKK